MHFDYADQRLVEGYVTSVIFRDQSEAKPHQRS